MWSFWGGGGSYLTHALKSHLARAQCLTTCESGSEALRTIFAASFHTSEGLNGAGQTP